MRLTDRPTIQTNRPLRGDSQDQVGDMLIAALHTSIDRGEGGVRGGE
jgi:hypothetical protein